MRIRDALQHIAAAVKNQIPGSTVNASPRLDAPKLVVGTRGAVIKVEPNATLRGSVFEQSVSVPVLSEADLYGGKLVAALDRQHPRDLFDTKLLLDAEGLTDEVRTPFVVYLASHGRPISEILDPALKPLQKLFDGEFAGMTRAEFTCRELEDTRAQLIHLLRSDLTQADREFLLSIKRGEPRWELIPVPHLRQLPGIKWKLKNIEQLAKMTQVHDAAIAKLKRVLDL